jgi:hypothetical protein
MDGSKVPMFLITVGPRINSRTFNDAPRLALRETVPVDRDVSYRMLGQLATGQSNLLTRLDSFFSADRLIDGFRLG